MQLKTQRDKRSEETRKKIIEAADIFIKEHGIDSLTVKNLCTLAGVSNGTFFHFFNSKENLIAAYMHFAYDRYTQDHPFFEDSKDYIKNIIDIHMHNIEYSKTLGIPFIRCYYNINNPNLHNRGNMQAEYYSRYILSQLQISKEQGYLSTDLSLEELGADICMVAKGVIFEWGLCGESFDISSHLDLMLRIFLRTFVSPLYLHKFPETLDI